MSFHPSQASSTFRHLGLFVAASALTGLLTGAAACSSDSGDGTATGGSSASGSGSGGTSSNSAGKGSNDAGKASTNGGTSSTDGGTSTGGDSASGGEPDHGGGTASGGTSQGGTASGAGSSNGGSSSGGSGSLPGDDNWACVELGGSCICQNNSNPKDASVCNGTYKCCFAVPLGASTRCQCQDPYTSKCEDLAHGLSADGRVVDQCPP